MNTIIRTTVLGLITMLLSFSPSKSQSRIDSLLQELQKAEHDSVKVRLRADIGFESYIFRLSFWDSIRVDASKLKLRKLENEAIGNMAYVQYMNGNISEADRLFKQCFEICKEIGDSAGAYTILHNLATMLSLSGDNAGAKEYYEQSLAGREQIGDSKAICISLKEYGSFLRGQGEFEQALEYCFRAREIADENGDKESLAGVLFSLSHIYYDLENTEEALNYAKSSLQLYEEVGHLQSVAQGHNLIGTIYSTQENLQEAVKCYQESLKIFQKIDDVAGEAFSLYNIGNYFQKQGECQTAFEYLNPSLKIQNEIGDIEGAANTLIALGVCHKENSNVREALRCFESSKRIGVEIQNLVIQKKATEELFELYSSLNNWKEAFENYEWFISVKDSINNIENQAQLIKRQTKYEYEKQALADSLEYAKKEAVTKVEIKRKDLQQRALIGGIFLMLILAVVSFLSFVQKRKDNAIIAQERDKSDELLLNILPEETAQELKDKGHSDAQLIDHVTVLFTDFKGFTALSEQVTPKELVEDLHTCFSAFDHICEKYGIEKIKTIGDAYMAAGGLPSPNTSHAKDVAKAALEMAQVVEKGKAEKKAANLPFFEIRIGVHSGPVVAGIVGVKKFQYDIWGDTVNTASRMESSGEVGKVNISQSTYELLKDDAQFSFESRGKVAAKGKGEMEMYFVS